MLKAENFVGTMILVILAHPEWGKNFETGTWYPAQHRPADTKLNPVTQLLAFRSDTNFLTSLLFCIGTCQVFYFNTEHFPMFQIKLCVKRALNYSFASSFYPLRHSLALTSQLIVMVFFSKFTIALFALQFFAVQGFPAESRSDEINICGGNAYPCPVGYICCGPLVDINGTVYGSIVIKLIGCKPNTVVRICG
ncbi:hypothetical protein F5876DRAFT_69291 [Lentinula aff. lateritia]|uniref:Uncharacterized protein n=1 Tax=Lentinula aff. lateritia TaxID=2804960 RepID=A0ACC1TMS9_9AGAR|nr:hypothetical protein F5876DRAFT_69291 [Lentinula aff. lateritia]